MAMYNYWVIVCVVTFVTQRSSSFTSPGTECTRSNNVCTLPNEKTLRFFVLGDWGGKKTSPYVTTLQKETALSLEKTSNTFRPQFYLSTGDNFYDKGVKSVSDPRFNATFENVYSYGKQEKMPWYITAGNHDHLGNIQAQLDYAKVNPRWIFPSLSYQIRYAFGKGNGTRVDIFAIDTVVLCGDDEQAAEEQQRTGVLTQGPANITAANEALKWLENGLKKSNASFLFLMGHYPLYSTGSHGDTDCIKSQLSDMLAKYKVNAFFSGHDHQLQHLKQTGSNGWEVHHVVSGAAAKIQTPSESTEKKVPNMFTFPKADDPPNKGGYVYAEVKNTSVVFKYFRNDGAVLYTVSSKARN